MIRKFSSCYLCTIVCKNIIQKNKTSTNDWLDFNWLLVQCALRYFVYKARTTYWSQAAKQVWMHRCAQLTPNVGHPIECVETTYGILISSSISFSISSVSAEETHIQCKKNGRLMNVCSAAMSAVGNCNERQTTGFQLKQLLKQIFILRTWSFIKIFYCCYQLI